MAQIQFFGGDRDTGPVAFERHFNYAASDAFRTYLVTSHVHTNADAVATLVNTTFSSTASVFADYPFEWPIAGHTALAEALCYIVTDWDGSLDLGNALRADAELTTTVRWFKAAEGPTDLVEAYRIVNSLCTQTGALAKLTFKSTIPTGGGTFDWPCYYATGDAVDGPVMDVNVAPVTIDPIEDTDLNLARGVVTLRWSHAAVIAAT